MITEFPKFRVFQSEKGEIKTEAQWIEFAQKNSAGFAITSEDDKIRIVIGCPLEGNVLRELTEFNFVGGLN